MKLIIILFAIMWDNILCLCPERFKLESKRTVKPDDVEDPRFITNPFCVTLDAADICYTGMFTGTYDWNLTIMMSEQENLNKPINVPKFPSNKNDTWMNTCMKIQKPKICFKDYHPLFDTENLELDFKSDSIYMKRIKTSSSFGRMFERFWSSEYGRHYANVKGKLCLSWSSETVMDKKKIVNDLIKDNIDYYDPEYYPSLNYKKWHGVFQYTKLNEAPSSYAGESFHYGKHSKNFACMPIKDKIISIFSEHPDDVELWELLDDLNFQVIPKRRNFDIGLGGQYTYEDVNSKPISYDSSCFTSIKSSVCTYPKYFETSNMVSINFNVQGAKPFSGYSQNNLPEICIPSTIKKLCLHEDVGTMFASDINFVPKNDLQILNTMYFVSKDKIKNYAHNFSCNNYDEAIICLNTKTLSLEILKNQITSSVQFHPDTSFPYTNGTITDIHRCVKTCDFEVCFTENNKKLPWILDSTLYFSKQRQKKQETTEVYNYIA